MMRNKGILSLVLCLVLVALAQAYSPEYDENGRLSILKADLNRDGYFNIVDIGLVASAWLDEGCGLSNPCSGADVYPPGGDSVIDLRDFAVTAEDYGRCTDPTNPDCIHLPLTLFEPPSGTAVSFSGSHNGGPSSSPPVGNVDASFDPLNIPYPGYGGPGGGGASGIHAMARRYRALIPAGGHLGGSLVIPRPGGGGGIYWCPVDGITDTLNDNRFIGGEGADTYVFGFTVVEGVPRLDFNFGGSFGTSGNQAAKPLLPLLPSLPEDEYPYFSGLTTYGVSADNGFETVPTPSLSSYGTYGNQGAKPLVPRGGGAGMAGLLCEPTECGQGVLNGNTGSFGTYGNQGIKPLVPFLPGSIYVGASNPSAAISVQEGMEGSEGGWSSYYGYGYGTYGNQGAKPLLPSLPGGGGVYPTNIGKDAEFTGSSSEPSEDYEISIPEKGSASKLHLFSGEVCESAVDLHISSRGPDFVWQRIYRSRTGPNTVMGNGWDHSYNIYIEQDSSRLIVHNGFGRRDPYFPEPNGIWAADGFFRELAQELDGSFTMTFPHKGTWKFHPLDEPNAPGKISAITDRNGNSLTFDYDSLGRLSIIHDTLDTAENSRDITIAYNDDSLIESVTDWAGRGVTYEYYDTGEPNGSAGDLKSVTSPEVRGTPTGNDFLSGKTTTYTYTKGFADERLNHNLLTISDAKGQTYLRNIYGTNPDELSFDHVVRQIAGEGGDIIDITYMQEVPDGNNSYAVTRTVTNDRVGNVKEHFFSNRNELLIVREYTGRADPNLATSIDPNINVPRGKLRADDPMFFETRYEYNDDSLPVRITYPNGNEWHFIYDGTNVSPRGRGNLLHYSLLPGPLGADQSRIYESFEYDSCYNKVSRHTDMRGHNRHHDYDASGNRIRTTYQQPIPEPNIVYEWQYNEHGQLTASILPDNGSGARRRDEYIYYAEPDDPNYGYLENIVVDANNSALTATFQYDDVGNVTRITDPRGHDTQFVVNELNQVVRSISREVTEGSRVRHQRDTYYDENDNIVQVDVQNKDDQGVLQTNENFTTTCEYDTLNYPTSVEAEVDTTKTVRTEFEYDGNHNLTLIRSGEAANGSEPNNVIRCFYDERNLLFQAIRAQGDPNHSTTQYDYDGNGNLKKVSQGLGSPPRISSFEYDGFNRLVEVNDPMGNIAEYHYDPAGNPVSMHVIGELVDVPGNNNKTDLATHYYEYNRLGQKTREQIFHHDPNTQTPIGDGNAVTEFHYNDSSQLIRVVNDNGNETDYAYDTANRRRRVTDAKGNTVTYSYDENSNITALTAVEESDLDEPNEIFVTTCQYDNLDRLTRVADNNDNSTRYGYDSRGNCTRITNALENENRYEYDGLNRLIRAVRDMDGDGADPGDANDIVTSQSWDDNSRPVTQTDDNGNTTAYNYDALNRRTKITYADGTENQFVYDVHHNIVQTTDTAGTVVNSTYDLLNRLTAKTITPGLGVSDDTTFESYKYDGLSRLVYAQDNDSLVTRSHDSLSNVISETLNSHITTSVHDGLGNKLSCTYPGGRVITCTYDELNRKKVISADGTAISTYSYIGPGRVRRSEYGNNTKCEYTYDNIKRITSTKHSDSADGIIDQRSYRWDNIYNKTQRKDIRTGGPQLIHDYTYDAIDRLIQTTVSNAVAVVRETDYSLDGVGNRTTVTGSPNPGSYTMDSNTPEPADFQMNQYTTTPFDSRTYDKNGNLTISDKGRLEKCEVVYDYRNQMAEFNDVSIGQAHTYCYDALGRRIKKVVDSNGTPQTTLYFYDRWQIIEEQDGGGTTLATYVYGNYIDEVLSMQRGGENYYYHTDELYSVMAVTDDSTSVVERYEYQDYGEPSFFDSSGGSIGGSAIGNPYLFTGRRYDPETGWYNYRTRYLDPIAGRFTGRDPTGGNSPGIIPPRPKQKDEWCFHPGVSVWIDGELVQISKVSAGQKIGKIDGTGAAVRLKQIEKVEEHEGTFECYDIVLETGNCITVTVSHLFLVESGQWKPVESLRSGLKLKSYQGLTTIRTVTKSPTPFTGKVYNIKVKDGEEYFVGKDGVIVRDW